MSQESLTKQKHRWFFYRRGGVNQVMLRNAADLAALDQLDPKLWMALAMPLKGIVLDPLTLKILDTDQDGWIRPPEILAAVRWVVEKLRDPGLIFKGEDSVPLAEIADPDLLSTAERILQNLGLADKKAICLADVTNLNRIFAATKFNGDGIVPAGSAETEAAAAAIADILSVLPGKADCGGQIGVDAETVNQFFGEAEKLCAWEDQQTPSEELLRAAAAVQSIGGKIDDYFTRCRILAFDSSAAGALNSQAGGYSGFTGRMLDDTDEKLVTLPLAMPAPGKPLPLLEGVNPAWAKQLATLATDAVNPVLKTEAVELTEAGWDDLKTAVAEIIKWQKAKPETTVEKLGLPRLRELLTSDTREQLDSLIKQDALMRPEYDRITLLEKLLRFARDLNEVLTNMVNFADFYGNTDAVFQAGTLYLDARASSLCIEVTDPDRHSVLAGLSGAFLVYCKLTRADGAQKDIVAVITNGDSDNLIVGRNGVFYDRSGLDWLAAVTKIVSNPISVREAFWTPYKKLVRLIEEQIAKRAQAAETDSTTKLTDAVTKAAEPAQTVKPSAPGKLDLGTIALFGTAIGGVSALVAGFLKTLFGLGFWLPLGVLGVLLLISGPSMLLASMKLRLRNLGPLLDAGGWAVNTKARINIPFGASLTKLAEIPKGSGHLATDPFADKSRTRVIVLIIVFLMLLTTFWRLENWKTWFSGDKPAEVVQTTGSEE